MRETYSLSSCHYVFYTVQLGVDAYYMHICLYHFDSQKGSDASWLNDEEPPTQVSHYIKNDSLNCAMRCVVQVRLLSLLPST